MKTSFNQFTVLGLAGFALLGAGVSGCANALPTDDLLAQNYSLNPATISGAGAAGDYSCPASPNVLPDFDRWYDGTDQFTVCSSRTSSEQILVHGKTAGSDTICIYPAQYIDQSHVYAKPDVVGWVSQCVQVADGGVYASFSGVNFNAVFIVEQQNKAQMDTCLTANNYAYCPDFSFGRFR